jgi:hypothetical protein
MASVGNVARQNRVAAATKARQFPASSIRFDAVVVALTYWFLIGMYLDGWAHNHGQTDDNFFSPWHAVLYSGALAVGLVLGLTHLRNMLKGHSWQRALPSGYLPALFGIGIFALGGGFDLTWHTLFGIEANMEALLSPAHLMLATGSFLFVSAPFRTAWGQQDTTNWRTRLPAILSMTATLSLLTFFTQYANFAARPQLLIVPPPPGDRYLFNVYGVMSLVLPASIGMSVILLGLRRWRLPLGAVTVIWTLNTLLMLWLRLQFVADVLPALIAAPLGGLLADFLLWRFKPSIDKPTALRCFAFSVPFVTTLIYLLMLNTLGSGLWWQIHMWMGVPFIAGIASLFLSFLAMPLAVPASNVAGVS